LTVETHPLFLTQDLRQNKILRLLEIEEEIRKGNLASPM